jgi:hypothetical protein
MKKILFMVFAVGFTALFASFILADTGREGATRIERGSYPESRVVTIVDSAATLFMPPSVSRPDSLCKNFSSYTVYIGSNAAGTSLADIGLPVGASEYFRLDGSFTGSMYAIAEAGATNVKMRCLDTLVP